MYKNTLISIFAILFFILGYYAPSLYNSLYYGNKIEKLSSEPSPYLSQEEFELVFIYIGSSSCPASNAEVLSNYIYSIKKELEQRVYLNDFGYHTIGISNDYTPKKEIEHLSKFGSFQEIIIGNSWSNLGVLKYIYGNFSGPAVTPQIIVTFRQYRTIIGLNKNNYRSILNEQIILRKIGLEEIENWYLQGFPLPKETFTL